MTRWTPKRKAEILERIRTGAQTFETVRDGYLISAEELAAWQQAFDDTGLRGLRSTFKRKGRNVYKTAR